MERQFQDVELRGVVTDEFMMVSCGLAELAIGLGKKVLLLLSCFLSEEMIPL